MSEHAKFMLTSHQGPKPLPNFYDVKKEAQERSASCVKLMRDFPGNKELFDYCSRVFLAGIYIDRIERLPLEQVEQLYWDEET